MINIGDKVKIREDLDECIDYGNGVDYVWSMEQYKGKIAKIVDKDSHNLITIDLDKGKHYWTIEMFEDKELTKYKEENKLLNAKLELYKGALHSEHDSVHRANDLEDKLEKYKRAFEILKYNLEITKTNNICNQPIIEISCNMFVTPEQCELLEELLK